jgi:hypothetical protein
LLYIEATDKFARNHEIQKTKTFLKKYEKYHLHKEIAREAANNIVLKTDGLKKIQVQQIFIHNLQSMKNCLVQKVKVCIQSYSNIRQILNKNVIINEESVSSPYSTEHLGGIYEILYKEYNKAALGVFTDLLMNLLSESSTYQESTTNPNQNVVRIANHLKTWIDMNLFEFMSADHLFTVVLLRSYHPDSKTRKDGVEHVLEFARKLEVDEEELVTQRYSNVEYVDMPIFSNLTRWIEDVVVKSLQFSSKSNSKPNNHSNSNNQSFNNKGLESALSATRDTTDALAAESKYPDKPQVTGNYNYEVTRSHNLYTDWFPYTSTVKPCKQCPHVPKCFTSPCNKCKLFGHKENKCRQVKS